MAAMRVEKPKNDLEKAQLEAEKANQDAWKIRKNPKENLAIIEAHIPTVGKKI